MMTVEVCVHVLADVARKARRRGKSAWLCESCADSTLAALRETGRTRLVCRSCLASLNPSVAGRVAKALDG